MEQGYIGQTSNGWRYIEDDIDEDYEQERVESRVNWMGHLFVFGRAQFITALQNAYSSQEVVVLELTGLASQVAPMAELAAISEDEFEHLFFNGATETYKWQEAVPDGDDSDSILLSLLKNMRQFITTVQP